MQYGMLPAKEPFAKWGLRPVAILILLTLLVRAPLLNVPFDRNEGQQAYIAWRLGEQELPYRDWADQRPPGIFWVYQLALTLPMDPVFSVHLAAALWSAASACALFLLACRFLSRFWALIAAVLFAILCADPWIQGSAANTRLFMLLPLILAQLAFLSSMKQGLQDEGLPTEGQGRRALFMALSGAFTGIAVAFNQVAAVNWIFLIALYPAFAGGERWLRRTLAFAAWSTVGAALVWGLVLLYFTLRHGVGDLMNSVFARSLDYLSVLPWSSRWANCVQTLGSLARTQALVWLLAAAGFVALALAGRLKPFLFLVGWVITSVLAIGVGGSFSPDSFQPLLPALALAAVLGAEGLYGARLWSRVPAWGRGTGVALLLAVLPAISLFPFLFVYSPSETVRKIYPGSSFAEMPEVGLRIARLTAPTDRVFVFGSEPEVLVYAHRVSATRYLSLLPLYGPYRDAQQRQFATASEITQTRPAVVLDLPNLAFSLSGGDQYFTQWSQTYLEEHFRADSYLVTDRVRDIFMLPAVRGQEPLLEPGQQVLGALLVRKDR